MKLHQTLILILLVVHLLQLCTSSHSDDVIRNQTGTLFWGGSPELDGVGIIFVTTDTTYGIPGDKSEFSMYFPGNRDSVKIKADVTLTGETTVRSWAASYPEATLSRIRVQ